VQRRRRNADSIARTVLESDDELRGQALPDDVLPDGERWHPVTVAWWEHWRRSPMAAVFIATDWAFLLDTALLHHRLWESGKGDASEIRLRAAKFGATVEDRARLRITVTVPDEAEGPAPQHLAAVTDLDARRRRLTE
jgi:plasmid stability protein